MATTAAVLSIMVDANTIDATAKLTKFDKQLAVVNDTAKKGIEARLGGTYNPQAFDRYTKALETASRRAKDREAFRAELGANFNGRAFDQYERAVARAEATTRSARDSTGRFAGALQSAGSKAIGVASVLAGVSFGASVIAKASLDASVNFQQAMTLVVTQAGYSEKAVKHLTAAIEDMAPSVGFGPDELAKALFHIASAGIPASKAIDVLTAAAKGARVGNADLEQTANALVGVLRTAPKDIKGASDAMSVLSAIVGQGNLRLTDLNSALGTGVLPSAKAFGLGLRDVGGALDVLTSRGIPAVAAATRLRQTLAFIETPTKKGAEALASIGLSSTKLAQDLHKPNGLVTAVADLRKHLEDSGKSAIDQAQIVSHAFGGGRTSSGILTLLQNVDDLRKHTDNLDRQTGTKALDKAFTKTQRDAASNMARIKAAFQTMAVAIGNAITPLLPTIVKVADAVAAFIGQLQSGKGAGGDFARTIGKIVTAVRDVIKFLRPLWQNLITDIRGVFHIIAGIVEVFSGIFQGNFRKMWRGVKLIFDSWLSIVLALLKTAWHLFEEAGLNLMKALGRGIKDGAVWVLDQIIGLVNDIIDLINRKVIKRFDDVVAFANKWILPPGVNAPTLPNIPSIPTIGIGGPAKVPVTPHRVVPPQLLGPTQHAARSGRRASDHFRLPGLGTIGTPVSAAADKQTKAADKQQAAAKAQQAAAQAQQAAVARQAAFLAYWARIPSQAIGTQIKAQQITNALTLAQNAGNVGGQQRALGAQKRLEQQWLSADKAKLRRIDQALAGRGLSRAKRAALIADKLAILQEIGSVESDIGSTASTLSSLTSSATTAGGFNLAPVGAAVTLPTAYDAARAAAPQIHHHGTQVTVNVTTKADLEQVADILERKINFPIHARLRRAGLRGT